MDTTPETTRQAVRRVATEMLRAGELPTGREVQKRVGAGSFQTVYDELKVWARETASLFALPGIPDSMKDLLVVMWKDAVAAASAEYLPQIADAKQRLLDCETQNQLLQEQRTQEAAASKAHRDTLQEAIDEYQAKVEALVEQQAKQHQTEALLRQQLHDMNEQLALARKSEEEAKKFYQDESEKAVAQALALENRLMVEADNVKQQAKKAVEAAEGALRKEQASSASRMQAAERQIDEHKQTIFTRDQRLNTLTIENSKLLVEVTQARASAQHLAQENLLLKETHATLKAALNQVRQSRPNPAAGQ